jgi:hypothetical protein
MVATWLRTNGYDVAPIVDDNTRVGYVALEDLMYAPPDDLIVDHAQGISLDWIISVDAAFGDVLAALYESPLYSLGGQNRVTGVAASNSDSERFEPLSMRLPNWMWL